MELFWQITWPLWLGVGLAAVVLIPVLRISKRKQRIHKAPPSHLSPTLQWLNTAGALLLVSNRGSFTTLGGGAFPGNEWQLTEKWQRALKSYWGITDHDSALASMRGTLEKGMRSEFAQEMAELAARYGGYSQQQLIAAAKQMDPHADEDSYLPRMVLAARQMGDKALLGWDTARVAYLSQYCYLAGYLSMEEMLDLAVDAGEMAQSAFSSWEELMESYLLGTQFWQQENAGDPQSMTFQRRRLYDEICQGKHSHGYNPFLVDFHTPLSKEIQTDSHGILPKYQDEYVLTLKMGAKAEARHRAKQQQNL